ncbi:MAG: Uma2 family endonuclease [Chloroflexota bacterium]
MAERLSEKLTVEEYIAMERESEVKYEYIDGEVFAMAGGSDNHSLIATNCSGELRQVLRGTNCSAFNSDLKVKITDIKYVYPDFTVVCGERQFSDDARTMLVNPILVGEVISPSSENYDLGLKGEFYRSLPSVQAYLILDQDKPRARLYTRHELGWLLREFNGLDATIPLDALECQLKLSEAYLNVFDE